jgi:NAD+ synthase (glutamine-hydrolysing)
MKIGLLQCNLVSNGIERNKRIILEAARRASASGAALCVSSELALCGCPGTDILKRRSFSSICRAALDEMSEIILREKLPPLLLGAPMVNPVPQGNPLHNCAVLLRDGKVMVIARKVLLSTNGAQADHNYFEAGVSCGMLQINGWRFCVAIGADMWNDHGFWKGRRRFDSDPVEEFMRGGADAIINLTAAPYYAGSGELHRRMLAWSASRYHAPVLSVNQVGGMDSGIYMGGSMLINAGGVLCAQAALFQEDLLLVDLEQDIRNAVQTQNDVQEELWQALVLGLRDFVRKSGFSKVILGLSGALDAALVAVLAVEALGAENVLGVLMPSPSARWENLAESEALARSLGIRSMTLPVAAGMAACLDILGAAFQNDPPDGTETRILAYIRGNILLTLAKRFASLPLSSGNKTAASVGNGGMADDFSGALCVLGDLYVSQIRELAEWVNAGRGLDLIPRGLLESWNTALLRLETGTVLSCAEVEPLLRAYIDDNQDMNGLIGLGFDENIARLCIGSYYRSECLRRQSPPSLQVSRHADESGYLPVTGAPDFSATSQRH